MGELTQYWPVLSAALIVPIVDWLKGRLPDDWPIRSYAISLILSVLVAWGAAAIFAPETPLKDIILWVLGTQAAAQGIHAVKKTKDKVVL